MKIKSYSLFCLFDFNLERFSFFNFFEFPDPFKFLKIDKVRNF
jgi:hypothetical protein